MGPRQKKPSPRQTRGFLYTKTVAELTPSPCRSFSCFFCHSGSGNNASCHSNSDYRNSPCTQAGHQRHCGITVSFKNLSLTIHKQQHCRNEQQISNQANRFLPQKPSDHRYCRCQKASRAEQEVDSLNSIHPRLITVPNTGG